MSVLEVNHVKKIYTTRLGGNKVEALHDISFSVENGEYIAIMGESGSGKTTLLNILAALDKPTAGEVILKGIKLSEVKESQIAQFRRDNLGFVFQDFNLLDTFSLRDNIFLPLVLAGKTYGEMYRRLEPIADKLGISHLLSKISIRSFRRSKAKMRGCKGTYNKSSDYFSRRAYGSARQQIHRRAFKHLLSNKQRRSDHSYGNAFCQGGKSCRTRDVYQGRRDFSSDIQRKRV